MRPYEIAVPIPFCEDAYETWLAVEDPADIRSCDAGVAPGGRDRDAHLILGSVAGAAVEARYSRDDCEVARGGARSGKQVIVSWDEVGGRCEGL